MYWEVSEKRLAMSDENALQGYPSETKVKGRRC